MLLLLPAFLHSLCASMHSGSAMPACQVSLCAGCQPPGCNPAARPRRKVSMHLPSSWNSRTLSWRFSHTLGSSGTCDPSFFPHLASNVGMPGAHNPLQWKQRRQPALVCRLKRKGSSGEVEALDEDVDGEEPTTLFPRIVLWALAAGYVVWLFILPYAPGDPVWAISPQTVSMLIDLSLNFFYILPILNAGGIHVMESPVVHPAAEALFNLVIGWTVLFGPLLFTDRKRDRFQWPLELWWILQMLLTNTFLIPYMAIRLNAPREKKMSPSSDGEKHVDLGWLGSAMTSGAPAVGLCGALVGLLTVFWFLVGRPEFGSISDRWHFFTNYVESERLAYAFIWDLLLYTLFQPWIIRDNISNVAVDKAALVRKLCFVPYVGLIAYLWGLPRDAQSEADV